MLVETLSEEMRILYVALTRSKEKLIITGIQKDFEKKKEELLQQISRYKKQRNKINPILVKKYIKYIDWILMVYFYEQENIDEVKLNSYSKMQILSLLEERQEKEQIDVLKILEEKTVKQEELEQLEKQINSQYLFELSTKIPTKSSVTKLKQKEKIDINFEEPKFLKKEEDIKLSNAQKGTLLHLCLQKLDESKEYTLENIKELIKDLEQKEVITKKEAQNINPHDILTFTKSTIWEELKTAKEIYREKPFYIEIPAKDIYQKETEEKVLVQGIIDLFYKNKDGEIVLVDYKTDYVKEEKELIEKYKTQLILYKTALEEALQTKLKACYLYSTYLGKEIAVENFEKFCYNIT